MRPRDSLNEKQLIVRELCARVEELVEFASEKSCDAMIDVLASCLQDLVEHEHNSNELRFLSLSELFAIANDVSGLKIPPRRKRQVVSGPEEWVPLEVRVCVCGQHMNVT